jgi:F-type H+-transporting ATPase subunit b
MLIDWFTVAAQAVNFLILVWLMKRFLYQPILHAIDTREKKVGAERADADAKRVEAQKERDEFQRKNEQFDRQRAALLSKATEEAEAERQRLLEDARQAADASSRKRMETLRDEARNVSEALARRVQEEVFAIARKALGDLATTSLEERLGEVFTRRLREMDGPAKAGLAHALKTSSAPALVRSAFDLPTEPRAAIQNALNETFSADVPLRFETAPALIGGIELTSNGQKLAWSIADYIGSLERGVAELLKAKDKPEAKAAPQAHAKAELEAKSEPGAEPKPEEKAAREGKSEAGTKPNSRTAAADGESKPQPKAESRAEPKAESTRAGKVPAPEPDAPKAEAKKA